MSEACPDDNELTSLVEGRLEGEALLRLESHVDGCFACSTLLADLAAVLVPNDAAQPPNPGRYRLLAELGSGAQGVVHEAYDRNLGRRVALKRIRPDLAIKSPALVADARLRLEREARTLAGLSHPNVVALFDVESEGEELILVQELVDGEPLDAWLRHRAPSHETILDVFAQAAAGLHAAHAAGVVHRDVKPANILVGKDGRVRVTDFGLAWAGGLDASLTQTGAAVGTPAYMAPEQLAGKPADARSDQYSLAVASAEAMTGERPLPNATPEHLEDSRRTHGRAPIDQDVLIAIARALAARPLDRFESIAVFGHNLRATPSNGASAGAKPIDARTVRPPPPVASPSVVKPLVAGGALIGAVALIGYTAWHRGDATTSAPASAPTSLATTEPTVDRSTTPPSAESDGASNTGDSATRQAGSPNPSASHASGTGMASDSLTASRRARVEDPKACVTHHDALAQSYPSLAAQPAIQRERAECEMLAGQCDVGRGRMRTLLTGEYAGAALEDALDALTQGTCKHGTRGPASAATPSAATTAAAVTADDARDLAAAAHEAWKNGDVARCRALGDQATRLARPGLPIETSTQLASAIGLANDCLVKNGDCASAKKNFVAQYPKLYPQLVANGVDSTQRETMFKASFPSCANRP